MAQLSFDEFLQVMKIHLMEQGLDEAGIDSGIEALKNEVLPKDIVHEMGRRGHRVIINGEEMDWANFNKVLAIHKHGILCSTDNVHDMPNMALILSLEPSRDYDIRFNDGY